jgi:hypothetical protein
VSDPSQKAQEEDPANVRTKNRISWSLILSEYVVHSLSLSPKGTGSKCLFWFSLSFFFLPFASFSSFSLKYFRVDSGTKCKFPLLTAAAIP